jgi:hypothetical protein
MEEQVHRQVQRQHPAHGGAYRAADGRSRMGDYSEIMTVRELIDLVAFLRSLQ